MMAKTIEVSHPAQTTPTILTPYESLDSATAARALAIQVTDVAIHARLIVIFSQMADHMVTTQVSGPFPAVSDQHRAATSIFLQSTHGEPMKPFQDYYPENVAHCYGCGKLNSHGHQIETFWEGDETVTHFTPELYHTSVPGFAYGGLIASLVDCHSTGTAAAAMYRAEGREMDTLPAFRFVTGSLHVDFLKPTPLSGSIEIRGRVKEIKGRKVVVETTVLAAGVATARGEVVALQMPENFGVGSA